MEIPILEYKGRKEKVFEELIESLMTSHNSVFRVRFAALRRR